MKQCFKKLAISSLILGLPLFAEATLPPAYLSVPNFQQCLSTKSQGSYSSWCMPSAQPAGCPNASWQALLGDNLPSC